MKSLPIFLLLLALLAAVVSYFTCDHCRHNAEGHLNAAARKALDKEGFSDVDVTFDRLDAKLSGQVPNDEAKIKAGKIIADLSGARLLAANNQISTNKAWVPSVAVVDPPVPSLDRPTPNPEAQPSSLDLLWEADSIRIQGLVRDEATKLRVLRVFQAQKPGFRLIDNLKVDTSAKPTTWAAGLPALLTQQLQATETGAIQLNDSRLVLNGAVKDEATKTLLGNRATQLVDEVENHLAVMPNVSNPPSETAGTSASNLALNWDNESIRIKGLVREESTKESILGIFRARKPGVQVIDDLKVAPNAQAATWAPELPGLLAQQLQATDSGSLELHNSSLILSGMVKDEAIKTRLGSEAAQLIEDASRVDNRLTVAAVPIVAAPKVPQEAQAAVLSALKDNAIYFGSGSRSLSKKDVQTIKALAETVKGLPVSTRLFVGGYADSSGNPEANRKLSIARANVVKDQLVAFGVPTERLDVESFGAEETSGKELWRSRRVELSIQESSR